MQDFEKLGAFYLGREYDLANQISLDDLILYDSKDLTTHAVVVGMTGSGKTGLCLGLLEEAGMDRIPAIVIDPKGDIANLLLTFPDLQPNDFAPWVDESQAAREGVSLEQFAASEASKWKKGLESWGQSGQRIKNLRDNVEMRVYTPGSNAGRPVTILKSFDAPHESVISDSDALRERISSATSGLLALLGLDADPIRSREHIFISNILDRCWRQGENLDLGQLIGHIQSPPFEQVGVMQLETFFPAKDRMALAMTLNNLLASPSFSSWMTGESLNIKSLLHNEDGKPCISIMSIAHLNDNERMFFVTILLNEILSWMRSQAGTSSLRAILYMDEVFGYFPPTQNPPSKQPMLTLLKQARAYGLGVVLATQNPVDLDYKGLSNTGTWFLGRLQTERDKARVLEGLEGASAQTGSSFDRGEMEKILAGLGSRRFLMNNVHDDEPVIFETRWAMSYLRGPLTRNQIQKLVEQQDPTASELKEPKPAGPAKQEKIRPQPAKQDPRILIPGEIEQRYATITRRIEPDTRLVYRPALFATGRLHYVRASYKVDHWVEKSFLPSVNEDAMPNEIWTDSEMEMDAVLDFDREAGSDAEFAEVPSDFFSSKNYKIWQKELKSHLYRDFALTIWRCKKLKLYSEAEETLGDFKVRIEQKVSELRDAEMAKLRKKYQSKFQTLKDRIRRAEDKVEREEEQYQQSRTSSIISIGQTIMGAVLGRRTSRSAGTSIRSYGRAGKEKADIQRAKDSLEDLTVRYEDLESEFNVSLEELEDKIHVDSLEFEELTLAPRKSDLSVEEFCVCWLPWKVDSTGIAEPVY
ncbi:MAG: DUF87 domain-containing protein [Planctomycetota bacterium]